MEVIFSDQKPSESNYSIFLAGPTPRSKDVSSWRPEAIQILGMLGWQGVVMVPERNDWESLQSYDDQVEWEQICLHACRAIIFWVPRELKTMPAFTTNVEFGYWIAKDPNKVFYGRPANSPKNDYLDWMYRKQTGREPDVHFEELARKAVKYCAEFKS